MIKQVLLALSGQNKAVKGLFNTIFPKAGNTKIGRFASGVINGAASATPLTFFRDFARSFFDTNKDGELTISDFKGMDIKTFGMGLGFLVSLGAIIYFLSSL